MAGNTVRKYNYEPEEEVRKSPRLVVDPQKVSYSAFEKLLAVLGLLGAVALITLNVSATYAQRQLTNVKESITKQKNATADLQQEIGELSSNTRLNKIAQSQGLKLRENNIRIIR